MFKPENIWKMIFHTISQHFAKFECHFGSAILSFLNLTPDYKNQQH